ncbi:unnamed protein product [Discosporangium mesarthrocarpum]
MTMMAPMKTEYTDPNPVHIPSPNPNCNHTGRQWWGAGIENREGGEHAKSGSVVAKGMNSLNGLTWMELSKRTVGEFPEDPNCVADSLATLYRKQGKIPEILKASGSLKINPGGVPPGDNLS